MYSYEPRRWCVICSLVELYMHSRNSIIYKGALVREITVILSNLSPGYYGTFSCSGDYGNFGKSKPGILRYISSN